MPRYRRSSHRRTPATAGFCLVRLMESNPLFSTRPTSRARRGRARPPAAPPRSDAPNCPNEPKRSGTTHGRRCGPTLAGASVRPDRVRSSAPGSAILRGPQPRGPLQQGAGRGEHAGRRRTACGSGGRKWAGDGGLPFRAPRALLRGLRLRRLLRSGGRGQAFDLHLALLLL